MCGRYSLYQIQELTDRFEVPEEELAAIEAELGKHYNIGPSQVEPAIIEADGQRHIELMRWGFMARWAKNERDIFKYKTFNARSEEIFDKPLWKRAIRHNRCLVPSNGFYEWRAMTNGKQPFYIRPKDQGLFAFAGIYGSWEDSDGLTWDTYSILTTRPNQQMAPIHDRMPVIVHPDDEDRWLDSANDDPEAIADILEPYPDNRLEIYEVSREVNTTRVDKETLVAPVNSR